MQEGVQKFKVALLHLCDTVAYKPQFVMRVRYKKEWRLDCMVVAAILNFLTPSGHCACPLCWPMIA